VVDTLARVAGASLAVISRFHETMKAQPDGALETLATLFDKVVVTPVTTSDGRRYQLEGVADIGRRLALDSDAKGVPGGTRPRGKPGKPAEFRGCGGGGRNAAGGLESAGRGARRRRCSAKVPEARLKPVTVTSSSRRARPA
jgi:hypothetical protein